MAYSNCTNTYFLLTYEYKLHMNVITEYLEKQSRSAKFERHVSSHDKTVTYQNYYFSVSESQIIIIIFFLVCLFST